MSLFPEVQKRAQAEIDSVVGQDRLPSYKDREHLPYCEVLVQEVYRWFSVVPIGKCGVVNYFDYLLTFMFL